MAFFLYFYYTYIVGDDDVKKTKKNNVCIILLLVSFILITISIFINESNAIRPILWLLGIVVLAINLKISSNYTKSKIIVLSLIAVFSSIIVDGIIVCTFKRIPVFTYNIIQNNNIVVYSSLGMRVWQCDINNSHKVVVDPFYKNGYMCDATDIEAVDINTFLNTIVQNHAEYKNNYVKIKGKISKKSGVNSIEMKPYTVTDVQVNGYVEFADNITLKIIFKDEKLNMDSYDVYDEITIIGIVKNMESNQGNHVIYVSDSELLSEYNFDKYILTVTKEKKCSKDPKLVFAHSDYELFSYCLTEAIVTYRDGQYELSSVLSSNKLKLESLYSDYISVEEDDNHSKLYYFDDYNLLVCNTDVSKDIYIGTSKMKFKDVDCKRTSQ